VSKYSTDAGVACGTTLPLINVTGSAAVRSKIYDLIFGFSTAPADVATLIKLLRTTDAGTGGSALTVSPLDPLTVAATTTAKSGTFSGAPTIGAVLMRLAINQRATYRWIAREGAELTAAAAAANGIESRSESSGGTPTCDQTVYFEE
jgi:hypothetical protein